MNVTKRRIGDGDGAYETRVQNPLYGGNFTTDSGVPLPFVLPGELVAPPPGLEIIEPSPHRVALGCQHFGICGGCHYQHAAYPAQLDLKREVLQGIFAENALAGVPEIQPESGPEWHYRNRIRLRIAADAKGKFQAGYSLRGSNEFLSIHECPIAAPLLWNAAKTIVTLAETDGLLQRWLAITSEIELFCNPTEAHLQLQFFLRSADGGRREASSFSGFCERLQLAIPEVCGAGATLDPELNRRARRSWAGVAWGAEGLTYPVAGRNYWVPRGAFFQVNRFLIDRLVRLVTEERHGALAWDLYAGVGLFTRALADRFDQVVAVEGADTAAASLTAASRTQNGIEPVHSSTLDFLRARELQRERPSLIVLDPPRAGLGAEAARILTRIGAPTIVYVSCDPTTLARDLSILSQRYRVEAVHLIDLFPQTFHLETVVHLKQ